MHPAPLACCLALCVMFAVAAAIGDDPAPPPEPIPLRAAAIATPVRFPTVPPIGATPMFVSTAKPPVFFSDHHRKTLLRGYGIGPPDPAPEMH